MKIEISREVLSSGIQAVLDIVPSKTSLPILSNILIDANESKGVSLSATDLDISITCSLDASIEEPGSTTVPARKFSEIVRELPEGDITLQSSDGRVSIQRQDGVEGSYALMSVPADDFPELPKEIDGPSMQFPESEDEVQGNSLSLMVTKTAFAVSRDETRPVLNGVLWQVGEGRMTMVATDGHRLVKFSKAVSDAPEGETEAIVPPRALNHLVKLMTSGSRLDRVQFGQSHLMFDLTSTNSASGKGEIHLCSRLIEGPFVDYEQVIPQSNQKRLKISNDLLTPAVRRVSVLASSQTHQLRFKLQENEVELSASSQEIGGEARERVTADYEDEEMTIGYNSTYLQDVLRRIESEEVTFELDSAVSAGIIRPSEQPEGEDYLCLLMPLRLNE